MPDDVSSQPQGQAGQDGQGDSTPQAPASLDEWLKTQSEEVRSLVSSHTSKLQRALDAERGQRDSLKSKLQEAQKAAEAGSALQGQLQEALTKMEETERRASFFENAPAELTNARAAYALVKSEDLFDKRGNVDWDALKKIAPEFFRAVKSTIPPANAGTGSGQTAISSAEDMNRYIRKMAGRG